MRSTFAFPKPVAVRSHMWLRFVVAAIVALGMIQPAGANATMLGTVQATSVVNIRACPTLDCDVIGMAKLGESMEITGEPVDGFYPVRWYDRDGFVYSLYLKTHAGAPWFVEGNPNCHQVALVFNIGIGYEPSQTILDTLDATQSQATMFPMGWWSLAYPEFLQQLDDSGYVIGTHGDQPIFLTDTPNEMIHQDVSNSVRIIESVIGRDIDQYFTPYAADTDDRVRQVVSDMGLLPVGWRVSANDFGTDATEQSVYDRVMDNVYPGAIIELHLDGPATEQSTALALPRIIDDLRAQGYELVTVPDMVNPCQIEHSVG